MKSYYLGIYTWIMSVLNSLARMGLVDRLRSFSEKGNPTLKTTLMCMRAIGIDLTAKVHHVSR
jgi:DNA-binding phage protein